MSDSTERIETVQQDHGSNHRLAIGAIAGTAVGVGLGMLLAPRKGSELREQVKAQASHLAHSASDGCHRAADAAGNWAHRCRDAYDSTRHRVADAAHETTRYVREVADAVTLKARKQVEPSAPMPASQVSSVHAESVHGRFGASPSARPDVTARPRSGAD